MKRPNLQVKTDPKDHSPFHLKETKAGQVVAPKKRPDGLVFDNGPGGGKVLYALLSRVLGVLSIAVAAARERLAAAARQGLSATRSTVMLSVPGSAVVFARQRLTSPRAAASRVAPSFSAERTTSTA